MPKVSALTRIDHVSEHGRWTLLRCPPSPALAPFVREVEGYVEEGGHAVLRKELPSGRVPLILIFGPGFTLHDVDHPGRNRSLERSFIAGLHERHSLVGSEGRALCMQVDFTPLGARRFLNVELREIAGAVVEVNAIVGSLIDRLEERLSEATSWSDRFATVEHFLLRRLMTPAREHRLLRVAWDALEASAGAIRIGKMASDLDCSRKHLVALFQREIGLAPKTIARVLRFSRAIEELQSNRTHTLADLAAACGYADQAHFNRDFATFSGESPTALLRRMLPDGTGVIADQR